MCIYKTLFFLFFILNIIFTKSYALGFHHLECGIYEMRGLLTSKEESNEIKYFLNIYPKKSNYQLKRTRSIRIEHTEQQSSLLRAYDEIPVVVKIEYLRDSNKKNYVKLKK